MLNDLSMYIQSEDLLSRINEIAKLVNNKTNGVIYFEEFITLPYFGFIILRFNTSSENISLIELDEYESLIYEIVGNDFLIDFMGSVYKKVGVNLSLLESKFIKYFDEFKEENIDINSFYKDQIRKDASNLLNRIEYDINSKVWEIQLEDDEILLFILGRENKIIKQKDNITLLEVNEKACFGLVRAAFYAKRKSVSLGRILLEY